MLKFSLTAGLVKQMNRKIMPIENFCGEIKIPGDKSVSHRGVMLAALGDKPVRITNFLPGADCLSTAAAMKAAGAKVEFDGTTSLIVTGNGFNGLKEPTNVIDAGNSGTTLRLLMGLFAAQNFFVAFAGDESLTKRPMARVIKPLSAMGAKIFARANNKFLPVAITPPGQKLRGITYESPVASAQVKSAILLAGLFAEGKTTIVEPYRSRDHTERMLASCGVKTEQSGNSISVTPPVADEFSPPDLIEVPGDISSAAYWLVAASIIKGSHVTLKNVGINPTRTGIIDVLNNMGANINIKNRRTSGGEIMADIETTTAKLRGATFGGDMIPRLIDEIPIIAAAALFAEGETVIKDAGELRVKETDRIKAITDEFNKISPGAVKSEGDTLIIQGNLPKAFAKVKSFGDHRMAMSLAVAAAAAKGAEIEDADCVNISYPEFYETIINERTIIQ